MRRSLAPLSALALVCGVGAQDDSALAEKLAACTAQDSSTLSYLSVVQNSLGRVTVTAHNFNSAPQSYFLVNEEGAVVADLTTSSYSASLYWNTYYMNTGVNSQTNVPYNGIIATQPLSITAWSCPPPANASSAKLTWRGIYETKLATCCGNTTDSAVDDSSANVANQYSAEYAPTITAPETGPGSWAVQRLRVAAPKKAMQLNVVKDSNGNILSLVEAGTGAYSVTVDMASRWIPSTARSALQYKTISQWYEACAVMWNGFQLCDVWDAKPMLTGDLEASPSTSGSSADYTATYSGTSTAPHINIQMTTGDGDRCVTYIKGTEADGSTPYIEFALSSAISFQPHAAETTATLYSCCGVTFNYGCTNVNNGQNCANYNTHVVRCGNGGNAMRVTTLNVGQMRSAATSSISAAFNAPNAYAQNDPQASTLPCEGGVAVGHWTLMESSGSLKNCTCRAATGDETHGQFQCRSYHKVSQPWTEEASAAVIIGIVTVTLFLLFLFWVFMIRKKSAGRKGPFPPTITYGAA